MMDVTLEIDDDVLEKASVIAERNGTTVEVIVLEFLTNIARGQESISHGWEAESRAAGRRGGPKPVGNSQ